MYVFISFLPFFLAFAFKINRLCLKEFVEVATLATLPWMTYHLLLVQGVAHFNRLMLNLLLVSDTRLLCWS